MVEKWEIIFLWLYFIVAFCPFLFIFIAGVPLRTEVETSLVTGFITASGIFAGFLTGSAISRKEALDLHHYLILFLNLGFFFFVLNIIFVKHLVIVGKVDMFDFGLVMVTVNANAFIAIMIALRLFFSKVLEQLEPLLRYIRSRKKQDLPPPPHNSDRLTQQAESV